MKTDQYGKLFLSGYIWICNTLIDATKNWHELQLTNIISFLKIGILGLVKLLLLLGKMWMIH